MKIGSAIILVLIAGAVVFGQVPKTDAGTVRKTGSVVLQPCEIPGAKEGAKEKARCGDFEVFENRALKSGRKIRLKIVVLPATGQEKAPDPLFYIPGGPGSSAIEDAPFVAADLARVRARRDLVFVDQRGTGGSNPLNCELFDASNPQNYLEHWNPLEAVRKCRAQLETQADLGLYVTSLAMDDLDDVRAALGYEKINLLGTSYGTRAAQEYLRRHGGRVRAVILHGVSPTGQLMPRDFPRHTERALEGIIEECAADRACREAFPNLRADAKTVLEKLLRGSVEVDVKAPPDGKPARVALSRDLAAEAVRYMLYNPGAASRLPLYLHLAARGNFAPLAQSALFYRQRIVATGSTGLYLSVTCAEDLPWIKPGEGERNAENTFLGDYRLRQQREACALWRRGEIPKDYAAPVRSDVPVLIVTGQWDPVTPPAYGELVAKYLPNSLHLVVPSGGHGFGGLEGVGCVSDLKAEFIDRGSAGGLDSSCVGRIRRKGFVLRLAEPN